MLTKFPQGINHTYLTVITIGVVFVSAFHNFDFDINNLANLSGKIKIDPLRNHYNQNKFPSQVSNSFSMKFLFHSFVSYCVLPKQGIIAA